MKKLSSAAFFSPSLLAIRVGLIIIVLSFFCIKTANSAIFNTAFEGGSGVTFSESPAGTYNVQLEADPSPAPLEGYDGWFFFSLTNVLDTRPTIRINTVNNRGGWPSEPYEY